MSRMGFKPFQYLSSIFNSGLQRKAKREASIIGLEDQQMSLFDHIKDLRQHAFRAVLWLSLFSTIAFIFMEPLIAFLKKPYDAVLVSLKDHGITQNLSSISIFEVITVNFKICFLLGFVFSLPFMLFEIWKFISPALYSQEKKIARLSVLASILLFYLGISFGFFLIIPYFFSNALGWASQYAQVMITYENYFNTLITMLLIFGAVFEVPVILSLLGLAGILPAKVLMQNRRIAFLTCFIIGAILSPPDVISLCLVSIPMYLMVEISIFIIKKIEINRDKNYLS
ncbi:twin-arginine translocase subunit TatC [Pigmentibacter sp. JX0631]|uniref:twin-arginine translocase subunit TatC n=1 Tax=Pigmentibacter sp. JX0631 TaxID=2976982 RepID=UPI002468CE3D|nr:twin-arginine translocase subunit TatC [Pigmentibacter sp. JX0631]WGL60169.1 twin-arginine translocase subunit TatC [Pigmentibacter sp. JX0631]